MLNISKLKGHQINYLILLPTIKVQKELFNTPEWRTWKAHNADVMERRIIAYDRKFYSQSAKNKRYENNLGKYMCFDVEEAEALLTMSALHLYMYLSFLLTLQVGNASLDN